MAAPTNIWYTNVASPAQQGNQNTLANLVDPNLSSARVKLITAVYTMTGNEVANDAIYIARLPSGAIVNPVDGNVASEAVGTTATLSIGDTDTQGGTAAYDPARYSAALNIAAGNTTVGFPFSGGTTLLTPPTVPAAAPQFSAATPVGMNSGITDDWVWLIGTFATLSVPVAGKKIVFRVKVSQMD